MLPAAPLPLSIGARSRRSIKVRTSCERAGLAARRMTALLRGSASSVVRNEASAAPGAAPATCPGTVADPPSTRRVSTGTRSVATECFNGMTSMSEAFGTSSAAMMRASRRMFSA
jgi:hypothetical protein